MRRKLFSVNWLARRVGAVMGLLFLGAILFASTASAALPIGCVLTRRVGLQCPKVSYQFHTLNDGADLTFNQLLGINHNGVIAGYFGSGAQGHPNKGYLLFPTYVPNYFTDNNFPGSAQTQVTGLNNNGTIVGFYSTMNNAGVGNNAPVNDNHGWVKFDGHYVKADFPTSSPATPQPVDQLLGVNDNNLAVGFFTDGNGVNHGYTYDISNKSSNEVTVPGFTNVTAAAINNNGDIAGFGNPTGKTTTEGFLLLKNGTVQTLTYQGATSTMAAGVNNNDEVVGVATLANGDMHGFTWNQQLGFKTVDDPNGATTTTVNGVNACGDLVGFYVDSAGNTNGMLANSNFSQFVGPVTGKARDAAKTKRIRTRLPKGC